MKIGVFGVVVVDVFFLVSSVLGKKNTTLRCITSRYYTT